MGENLLYGARPARSTLPRLNSEEERELLLVCLEATMVLKHETDPDQRDEKDDARQLTEVLRYFDWVRTRREELRAGRELSSYGEGSPHRKALEVLEKGLDEAAAAVATAPGEQWAGATWAQVESGWVHVAGSYHDLRDIILGLGPLDQLFEEAEAADPAPDFPLPED